MSKTLKECIESEGVVAIDMDAPDYTKRVAQAIMDAYNENKKIHVLVPSVMDQDKLAEIESYCDPKLDFLLLHADGLTGRNSVSSVNAFLDNTVSAVFFENPVRPGLIEENATAIISASRHSCAIVIMGLGSEVKL